MTRLRLITFNIAHGRGLAPIQGFTSPRKVRVNLRRIAALLGRLAPDVVAMQEIDGRSLWSGNFDHLDYLRVHTRYPYAALGVNNRREGLLNLSYGNAVLSRHPLAQTETVVFGRRRIGEKGFLFAEIEVAGRRVPLVNLHLHAGSRWRRLDQLELLLGWLRDKHRTCGRRWALPPIVCGDFNSSAHRDDAAAALLDRLAEYGSYTAHPREGRTFPSPLPGRTLDFIFVPEGCRAVRSEVVRTFLSDHRPVMVELGLP